MPNGVYDKISCKTDNKLFFEPAEHQIKVRDYFSESKYKGLLLFHKLGSGKTCTSILIADKLLKEKKISKVFLLTPGSLRGGWISEYCETCGYNKEYLKKYFTFITYNFNVYNIVKDMDFSNSLVIIDEAHNLLNGVKNKSENVTGIYNKICSSKCKVLILSGTPIVHKISEWYYLGNLLKPNTFKKDSLIINEKDLKGIISYFPGDKTMYPKVIHKDPIKVKMSEYQQTEYNSVYNREKNTFKPSESLRRTNFASYDKKLKAYIRAKKFEASRRVSNFFYMNKIDKTKDNKTLPDFLAVKGGWVSDKSIKNKELLNCSVKFIAILLNISSNLNRKHVVFSWFKGKGGVELLHTLLGKCGIKSSIFSGDLSDVKRKKLLDEFNSESNRNGENITVLLLTDAGAEGINVLETNHIHLVESSTNQKRILQVIGRVVRFKSHIKLPENRRYVKVWRYWSEGGKEEKCIDQKLYEDGLEKIKEIDEFQEILIKNSIEN